MKNNHRAKTDEVHSEVRDVSTRSLYAVPERRAGREAYVPAGRTLHLVDLENLMNGPLSGPAALENASAAYRAAMPIDEHDHVIVGVNPALAVLAKAEWPSSRLAVRGGPDGADIALLETVKHVNFVASRYDQAVIGSGDGVFEVAVSAYRNCGVPVGVVARASNLAYVLGAAATFVRLLPEVGSTEVVA